MNEGVGAKQYVRQLKKLETKLKGMTHFISRYCKQLRKIKEVGSDDGNIWWTEENAKRGQIWETNLRLTDFEITSASVVLTERDAPEEKIIFVKI